MATPNVALLKQTLEHIETHPDEWDQATWRTTEADCGTACCFAGTAVTLAGGVFDATHPQLVHLDSLSLPNETVQTLRDFAIDTIGVASISDAATWLLGLLEIGRDSDGEYWLDSWTADRLFDPDNKLEDLQRIVAELCGETEQAAAS